MFVLALSLYNTWNRGVFLLCKITNLLIYSSKDADQLNRWVEQQKVLHVRVYKGDIVVLNRNIRNKNYGKRRFRQMNMSGWIITRSNLQMVRLR